VGWTCSSVSYIIFAGERTGNQLLVNVRNSWRNIIHGSQRKWVWDL